MKQEDLNKILNEHKLWLYCNGGSRADLRGADLRGAYLRGADLSDADLSGADLSDADLRGADLSDADLRGAYLRGADLRDADLRGADLRRADGIHLSCPDSGSFVAFKKANNDRKSVIVKLQIAETAKRSSATGRKCRCNEAIVLGIESLDGLKTDYENAYSSHDSGFIYEVGKTVSVENFDYNRFNECAAGIHFFITRQEAVEY